MVDIDAVGVALRILGYTIASPGLIAWSMITYRRRQYGVSALMVSMSLFMLCLLGVAYTRNTKDVQDTILLVTTFFACIIAAIVVFSLLSEFKRNRVEIYRGGSSQFNDRQRVAEE